MFGLFLCVEYLLPDTGYTWRSFVFSFCFSFSFRIVLSVLSRVLFAGESLLPCAPRVGAME